MKIAAPKNVDNSLYYFRYLSNVTGLDLIAELTAAEKFTIATIQHLPVEHLKYSYADGKWSVATLLQHIVDAERVYAYRALRFLRKDATPLAGFDEDDFASNSGANYKSVDDFIEEYKAIRLASIKLFQTSDLGNIDFEGTANKLLLTPRIIGGLMVGHNLHHIQILKERYLA